ncbi:MAG: cold-shock protein [Burkholderiales bacterium PBB2]|nr:MAG: cold-shock protein [Burkholderiales bacterium PBB2]
MSSGILRSWNDERGFGFIAPTQGGRELFVHISAFPQDCTRPTVGETLQFDLGPGKDGKPQALRVRRLALEGAGSSSHHMGGPALVRAHPTTRADRVGQASSRAARASGAGTMGARRGSSAWPRLILIVILVMLGAYGVKRFQAQTSLESLPFSTPTPAMERGVPPVLESFRCDGRIHCSQMSSCAEATYSLRNCPGVKMDGDGDGIACEEQWCGKG